MPYFRKKTTTSNNKYKKNYRKKAPSVRSSIKSAYTTKFNQRVLKVVNSSRETKQKVISLESNQAIPGAGLSIPINSAMLTHPGLQVVNILSTLALGNGTTQEERVGNEIDNCRLTIRGVLTSSTYREQTASSPPYNSSNLPFEVHMLVFKRKKNPNNNPLYIKSFPNNDVGGIDNTLINSVYPFNKDSYIIKKHRVFRLRPLIQHNTTGSSAAAGINGQQSNAPMFARFQCNIPISKKLMYADQTTVPTNDWVSVAFYVINPDGSQLINTTSAPHQYEQRANVSLDAVLTYKDA